MREIIEKYYKDNNVMPMLLQQKLSKFEKHKDIEKEFEYWIENGEFVSGNPILVEGYTAEKLAEVSKYLVGDGAFDILIELRENPKAALKKIADGFKMK